MQILLLGAAGMLLSALVLAWVATFCRLIPIPRVKRLIKDYGSLIRAHIDLLLMALFCLALQAIRVPLPGAACWLIVIGGFTNPGLFLLRAVDPRERIGPVRHAFRLACFATSTAGFGWAAMTILQAAM